MNSLKISIITPSLNQGKYISDALDSVQNQGYLNYEHIVIDGISTDNTIQILKNRSTNNLLYWICAADLGQSDALNKGFRIVKGDIIGWLNADDRYLPGCFETVVDYFNKYPEMDIIYGDYRLIDQDGKILKYRREIKFDLFILKYLHILYIPSTATFFRRKIFEENNFLNIDYHYAMDYEYFLRLALKGYKFFHIHKFLADFRSHPECKSVLGSEKQRIEQKQALIALDPYLKSINKKFIKSFIRIIFMVFARAKRTWIKLSRIFYDFLTSENIIILAINLLHSMRHSILILLSLTKEF